MVSSVLLLAVTLGAMPDLSALSAKQREVYARVAADEFCSCTSSLTLAACNDKKPKCKTAEHLSTVLARIAQTGLSVDEISTFMSSRVSGPFCGKPKTLKVDDAPQRGDKNAPLTVIEFADFRCPHCRDAAPRVQEALAKYGKKVRFIFVPYPLQNNPQSVNAAAALLAAGNQNKLWQMHEALFSAPSTEFELPLLVSLATKAGLDPKKFTADLGSEAVRNRVAALKQSAVDAGVEATPTFYVNGRELQPDPELFTFADRFEMELDRNSGICQ
jgi:protein-disulfide isomerase